MTLFILVAVATPSTGVTSVAEVTSTTAPLPVVPLLRSAAAGCARAGTPLVLMLVTKLCATAAMDSTPPKVVDEGLGKSAPDMSGLLRRQIQLVPLLTSVMLWNCFSVSVAAPSIVDVVGVRVTVPAPMFSTSAYQPEPKLPVACGTVTATEAALFNVMSPARSVVATVYVVPTCALIVMLGRSLPAKALKVGAAAAPLVGPANTCAALCVASVTAKVPLPVIGEPVVVRKAGVVSATEDTPPALGIS